jgi:hypothetical protein
MTQTLTHPATDLPRPPGFKAGPRDKVSAPADKIDASPGIFLSTHKKPNMTTSTPLSITTEQHFNRSAMGALWAIRTKLDPAQVGILKSLFDNRVKSVVDCITRINYKLSNKRAGKLGYGRLYGNKGSLETLDKDIRGSLCAGIYTDIDIVNCHPVLIKQYALNRYDLDMPYMADFIRSRSEIFDELERKHNKSRDECKSDFMKVMYNGRLDHDAPQLFHAIKEEMASLIRSMIADREYNELFHATKNEDNPRASFCSHIIQTEERRCLLALRDSLIAQGYSVDVLAYDGCMVRSTEVGDDVLTKAEEFIKSETGYEVQLAIKPLVGFRDLEEASSQSLNAKEAESKAAYDAMKLDWEQNHFYFAPTNQIVEVDNGKMGMYDIGHAEEYFNTWTFPGPDGQKALFLKKWRADETRRVVKELVYKKPEDCLPHEASLFEGFAFRSYTADPETAPADIARFMDLLGSCCNDETPVVLYVLNTFAHMIQKPFEKTGVCTIFSSECQGTGKDTLLGIIRRLIGSHSAHYTSTDAFYEKHDTQKGGAIFTYLEEACAGANKTRADELKARITTDTLTINPKGQKAYTVPNIARIFMTTNHSDPVKFEETDRRFLLINPSERLVKADWVAIYDQIMKERFVANIGAYLEGIDISGWKIKDIPMTEVKKEIVELSINPVKRFWEQWQDDTITNDTETWKRASEVYEDYVDWCRTESYAPCKSVVGFMKMSVPYKSLYRKHNGRASIVRYAPRTTP